MKITLEVADRADAQTGRVVCAAIADAFRMIEEKGWEPAETTVAVEAPAKTAPVEVAPVEETAPSAASNGAAEPKKRGRPKKTAPTPLADAETTIPLADAPDPAEARAKFRLLAQKHGALWVRPILVRYGAKSFTDLTDQQVVEAVHAAA